MICSHLKHFHLIVTVMPIDGRDYEWNKNIFFRMQNRVVTEAPLQESADNSMVELLERIEKVIWDEFNDSKSARDNYSQVRCYQRHLMQCIAFKLEFAFAFMTRKNYHSHVRNCSNYSTYNVTEPTPQARHEHARDDQQFAWSCASHSDLIRTNYDVNYLGKLENSRDRIIIWLQFYNELNLNDDFTRVTNLFIAHIDYGSLAFEAFLGCQKIWVSIQMCASVNSLNCQKL